MNRIRIEVNRETNYVYHTLSVMKCGYDNEYGRKHRGMYTSGELAAFEKNKTHITVCGGEHCGVLYGLMVSLPALGERPAAEYYRELIEIGQKIRIGNVPADIDPELIPYTDPIADMAEIMASHYDEYVRNIWPQEKTAIEAYGANVLKIFEDNGFSERAEALVGPLNSEFFTASLVSSVAGGAEAIDISREKDVFGIGRSVQDTAQFISHEYIIYLLAGALKGMDAFGRMETWPLTEGLAEYYLKKLTGSACFAGRAQEALRMYESIPGAETMTPKQLYQKALAL